MFGMRDSSSISMKLSPLNFLEMLETFLSVNSFSVINVSLIISNLIHSFLFISHLNFIANHHWVSNTIFAPHSPSWTNFSYTCVWLLRSRSWTNLSMALGSVYFSLNISTTMPFKDVLKWIFVARFFRRPLCFDANRDWQEDIWYESSPIKRSDTFMYFPRVSFLSQKFNHDVMDKEFELQLRRGFS